MKPIRSGKLLEALLLISQDTVRQSNESGRSREPAPDENGIPLRGAAVSTRRVLVVEDNAVNRKVAVRLLEKFGYAADTAENGIQALRLWEQNAYDAIIMDCRMPEMDGYEATSEIRRREAGRSRIPIIAMTANAMRGDPEKCFEAGMDDFLSKPVDVAQFHRMLEHWLSPQDGTPSPLHRS